jgi:hypothetical protein
MVPCEMGEIYQVNPSARAPAAVSNYFRLVTLKPIRTPLVFQQVALKIRPRRHNTLVVLTRTILLAAGLVAASSGEGVETGETCQDETPKPSAVRNEVMATLAAI